MMSASTWPGPTEGKLVDVANDQEGGLVRHRLHERLHQHDIDHRGFVDHQQVAIERIILAALEAAAFGIDLQQPVDGLGLEAGRFGHPLGGAARRCAQQDVSALCRKDAQNGFDDGGFPNPRAASHDQHLGHQCEPDRGDLAFGKGKTDMLLDPRQRLVWIDPGPRQRAICQPHQPLGDGALRSVQTGQKYAGRFTDTVGDHRAFLQLEIERGADELLWDFEQLLGQRY